MSIQTKETKTNINTLLNMKKNGEKITCLTAYDYTSAKMLDKAGIDIILVGDSLGMVMNGYDNTTPVTLDEVIYHTKSVKRGISRAFLAADMPFGSYGMGIYSSVENCVRVVKETGANAIKLEGGAEIAEIVHNLTLLGINVIGHIGLKPQSINKMGGYKIYGKDGATELIKDAKALAEAGAFAITLEGITSESAKQINESIDIITIGIGAGASCDAQILVFHDVFGLFNDFKPKFVKRYLNAGELIENAAKTYIEEVKSGKFPNDEFSF